MIYTTMKDLSIERVPETTNYYTCPWCGNTMCFLKDNDPVVKGCLRCGNSFTAKGTKIIREDKGPSGLLFVGRQNNCEIRQVVSVHLLMNMVKEYGKDRANEKLNEEAVWYIDGHIDNHLDRGIREF